MEDCIKVAKRLEQDGAQCLVLSGGFVSRAPMYVMRGAMPISVLTGYMPWRLWWLKLGVNLFGKIMVKDEPFKEAFFFDDSIRFRRELKMPLAFVGGVNSMATINRVLDAGFEFVEMARPLVYDTDFVNKLRDGVCTESGCRHANYCVARAPRRSLHRERLPSRQLLRGPHLELRHAVPRELQALSPHEARGGAEH